MIQKRFLLYTAFLVYCKYSNFASADPIRGRSAVQVQENEFPFIVSLNEKKDVAEVEETHFCGGTLIKPKLVLTISHCLRGERFDGVEVLVGSSNLRSSNIRKYDVRSWTFYDFWAKMNNQLSPGNPLDEPAIILLEEEVTGVRSAQISTAKPQTLVGQLVMIAGWGNLDDNTKPTDMRRVSVTVLSMKDCKMRLAKFSSIFVNIADHESHICTAAQPYAVGSCGDSGGPILDRNGAVVGIHVGSCPNSEPVDPDQVNIGSSVYNHQEFIQDVMNEQSEGFNQLLSS